MSAQHLKHKTDALRRQHVLDAAVRVFAARGFRGATIKAIAVEAGVSDGTIYNVFANKEALLFGVLEQLLQGGPSPPAQPAGGGPAVLAEAVALRWQHLSADTLAMTRIIWAEALTDKKLAKRYFNTILKPALEGFNTVAAGAADPELGPRAAVGLFLGLALLQLLGDPVMEKRKDDVPAFLSSLLMRGLHG